MPEQNKVETIQVTAKDMPVYCPGPKAPRWSMHPRVYLDVAKTGEALCPYCGAHYVQQVADVATADATEAEPSSTALAASDSEASA